MAKYNYESYTYEEFLNILTIEFSDFLRDANHAQNVRHSCLKSRKKSIYIRELLKIFRKKSLELEKHLDIRFKKHRK